MKIGVLGAGSWGTALAAHLARHGHRTVLWARRPELAEQLRAERLNADYLPKVELPPGLTPTSELADAAASEVVLMVAPSHGYREVLRSYLAVHPAGRPAVVVSAAKGLESGTLKRMSQVSASEGKKAGVEVRFACLAGPSFADELAAGSPTAAVIASGDQELAAWLREELSTRSLRLYSSTDVVGVELAGAAKNVAAIACGIIHGLELGHNTVALTITRGLHEITRLGLACGGKAHTLSGLAGLGDLVLTCTGKQSRNRALGIELAQGRTLEEITGGRRTVAEGVRNSRAVWQLAKRHEVEMPITREMVAILYESKPVKEALTSLMARELKDEARL